MKRLIAILAVAGVIFSGPLPAEATTVFSEEFCETLLETDAEVCDYLESRPQKPEPKPEPEPEPEPEPKVVYPSNLGEQNKQGYYRFPEAKNGEYEFTWFSWEYLRCGSKELIGVVYTAIINFNELYPDATIEIGEVNAPNHITHNRGVDIDVSGWENDEQAVEFGKALVDTDRIDYILYRDTSVIDEVNAYAESIGIDGPMRYDRAHSHFHVNIDDEFAGPRSTKCGRGW